FGGAALSKDEFHIDKKLASASVTKTVEMTDEATGATFEVSVDVSWTATSPATNTRLRFHDVSQDSVSNALEKATGRDASVSGSVLVGTTDLLEGATIDLADIFTRAEHGVRVDRSTAVPYHRCHGDHHDGSAVSHGRADRGVSPGRLRGRAQSHS